MSKVLGFFVGACLAAISFFVALSPEPAVETLNRATESMLRALTDKPAHQGSAQPIPTGQPKRAATDPASPLPDVPSVNPPRRAAPQAAAAPLPDQAEGSEVRDPAPEEAPPEPGSAATAGSLGSGRAQYLFWSPFRSELAARGFAKRLQSATAVEVDVVRVAPGEFRVAFGFQDEAHRLSLIARIEDVTGLELLASDRP